MRKEAENKEALKTKVTMLGQQLLRYQPSDSVLRDTLDNIQQQWLQLMCELPNNEEQLHAAHMQLLPSRQALNELIMWLHSIHATLTEDENQPITSFMDVQLHLQKYRVSSTWAPVTVITR